MDCVRVFMMWVSVWMEIVRESLDGISDVIDGFQARR
jgi:hypothetical protein